MRNRRLEISFRQLSLDLERRIISGPLICAVHIRPNLVNCYVSYTDGCEASVVYLLLQPESQNADKLHRANAKKNFQWNVIATSMQEMRTGFVSATCDEQVSAFTLIASIGNTRNCIYSRSD